MKLNITKLSFTLIFFFLILNVFLYTQTIKLGDEVSKIEKEIITLKQQNEDLKKKSASLENIDRLAVIADNMGLDSAAKPIYINNILLAEKVNHE